MQPLTGGWRVDASHHTPEQLFALAADVESYPRFLPWCLRARIRSRDGDRLEVENLFGLGLLHARFISHAEAEPPHRLIITSEDGPFRRFKLEWRFSPLGEEGCRVEARYQMLLRSPMMHAAAAMALPGIEHKVVRNFRERVRQVCGD